MIANLKLLIEKMHDGVYFTDLNRKITYWNQSAEKITGFSAREAVGRRCADNLLIHIDDHGNSLCRNMCPLAKTLKDGKTRDAEIYLHHKLGHRLPVMVRVTPLCDHDGSIIGAAELFTDLSNREINRLRVAELESLSMLDELTGLSNRRHMEIEIDKIFEEKKRYGLPFGLLMIEIDHFKNTTDRYGNDAGNKVLQTVARSLISAVRAFDLFSRWEGEKFVGLARNVDDGTLAKIGERVRMLVENSQISWQQKRLQVTASVGATMVEAGDTPRSIIKRAGRLLNFSKEEGYNLVTLDFDMR